MRTLSFTPAEWQSLCHYCRGIPVSYFHRESIQRFLAQSADPTDPELAAKVRGLSEQQLKELYNALNEDQLSRFGMGQTSQTRQRGDAP